MLCLPLRVENVILGVFCVYSDESFFFSDREVAFFSLMTDLTALAIRNLNIEKTKSWFLIKAAHQLKSPLHTLAGMIGTVRKGYIGPINDRQGDMLDKCVKRIRVLVKLIDDLLRLGKERSEIGGRELAPVDPAEVLSTILPLYRNQAAEKGVTLTVEIEDPVSRVSAHDQLLDELFTNLISNAVKYTGKGGEVTVSLTGDGNDRVRFEVRDTGIGIPEEDIPKLFSSEFFRSENAKELTEEGTGLGLVIVKEIMDRLGGTVRVESRIDEGTRLTCLLPAVSNSES